MMDLKKSTLLDRSLQTLGIDIVQDALHSSFIMQKNDTLPKMIISLESIEQNLLLFQSSSHLSNLQLDQLTKIDALNDLEEAIEMLKFCYTSMALIQYDHVIILRGTMPLLSLHNTKLNLHRCIGLDIYDYRRQLLRRKIAATKTQSN